MTTLCEREPIVVAPVRSPLTGGGDVTLLETLSTQAITAAWRQWIGIDISARWGGCEQVQLFRCNRTGQEFFAPESIAAGPELYEQLALADYYYLADKWEHEIAFTDVRRCRRVLDVGCGAGAFVERLITDFGVSAEGLESNLAAAESARQRGLLVWSEDIRAFAEAHPAGYDAVCAFQVLEHVPDLRRFLQAMLTLVRPGGLVVLAVPNQDSFIRLATNNVLDGPPHHLTRWTSAVLRKLPDLFPLRLTRLVREPLAEYHVGWFVSVHCHRWRGRAFGSLFAWMMRRVAAPLLRRSAHLRRLLLGHTVYACYTRLA